MKHRGDHAYAPSEMLIEGMLSLCSALEAEPKLQHI